MLAKSIVIVILIGILASLASAVIFMIRDKGQGTRTVRVLSIRIGISIALVILLYVLASLGYIQPNRNPF